MLSLFRTNQLLASVLLIPYALLLHVGYWLVPLTEAAPIHGIGSFYLQQWLGQHPVWMPTVVIGLLFIQGVLANLFMFDHRLGPDINLFTGVFVVFLGSLIPLFLPFAGYHVANIFLLLALLALMQVYKVNHAADHIFNTGLWLGIASMFQVQYLVFLLAALVGLTLLRKSSLREQLILTLGAFTPWLLVGFGFFWYGHFDLFWQKQWEGVFGWPQALNPADLPLVELGGWLVLILVALFSYSRYKLKTTMEVQKKLDLLFWFLFSALWIGIFTQPWSLTTFLSLAPVLGILIGLNFTILSRSTAEFWHFLLVVALLFWQLSPLFSGIR